MAARRTESETSSDHATLEFRLYSKRIQFSISAIGWLAITSVIVVLSVIASSYTSLRQPLQDLIDGSRKSINGSESGDLGREAGGR